MTTQPQSLRPIGGAGWNIWRTVVGLLYLVAAGFNLFYTMPQGDLDWFAESAWFPFLETFVADTVVPNVELFIGALVVFEVIVGVLILARGRYVDVGVGASVLWVLLLLPFLPFVPMGITNVVLAGLQGGIALRRYDSAIWDVVMKAFGSRGAPHPR